MINKYTAKQYCSDDISIIENYNKAINDTTQIWECHHRGEILSCGRFSRDDLKKFGLYYNRPASELIFLSKSEHNRLHRNYNNCLIEVTDKDGNIAYGSDMVTVAKALGCTKQLISQCIKRPTKFKSAKGCKIRVVDSVTLKPIDNAFTESK